MKIKKQSRVYHIVAAISLNGKITDAEGYFPSSPEDRQWLTQKIKASDVLVMGRKTFEQHVKRVGAKPIIVFTRAVNSLRSASPEIAKVYFFHDKKKDLIELLDLLEFQKITILGGAEIYHWFVKEKLLTDVFLTVEPVILDAGKNFLSGQALNPLPIWKLKSTKKLNQKGTLLFHYQI